MHCTQLLLSCQAIGCDPSVVLRRATPHTPFDALDIDCSPYMLALLGNWMRSECGSKRGNITRVMFDLRYVRYGLHTQLPLSLPCDWLRSECGSRRATPHAPFDALDIDCSLIYILALPGNWMRSECGSKRATSRDTCLTFDTFNMDCTRSYPFPCRAIGCDPSAVPEGQHHTLPSVR
jgi:hypothetical protein